MRFLHSLIIPYQELLGNYDLDSVLVLVEEAAVEELPPQPASRPAAIAAARVIESVFFAFMFFPPSQEKQ